MSGGASIDRRRLVLGGVMVATSAAAVLAVPRRIAPTLPIVDLDRAVPTRIGAYRYASAEGVLLPPRDGLSARLYEGYVVRTYVAPGLAPVMLLIAYGRVQDYQLQLHRPESCYPAFGYTLGPSREVELSLPDRTIGGIAVTATRQGVSEQLLYWTRIGDSYPTGFWSERMVILRDAVLRGIPDGVLVRLSTVSPDPTAATRALAAFNRMMIEDLGRVGRDCLFGATPATGVAG